MVLPTHVSKYQFDRNIRSLFQQSHYKVIGLGVCSIGICPYLLIMVNNSNGQGGQRVYNFFINGLTVNLPLKYLCIFNRTLLPSNFCREEQSMEKGVTGHSVEDKRLNVQSIIQDNYFTTTPDGQGISWKRKDHNSPKMQIVVGSLSNAVFWTWCGPQ